MALSNALSTALSGLRFTSLSTTLTGSNIANAGNAAYIKKRLQPSTTSVVDALSGVQPGNITREYDSFVQRQLQGERANSGYADTRATFLTRVDQLFGVPGSSGSLDSVLNDFSGSLQQLAASSDSYTARSDVVSKATVLAQSIRSLSQSVQNMRVDAEKGLSDAVTKVGSILNDLANVNTRLRGSPSNSDDRVSFLDQRDQLIADLSSYVDIRTSFDKNDNVQIITSTGYSLLAPQPPTLSFDARSQLSANNVYSSDPTKRSVGTITSVSGGSTADLIAIGAFRSGKIGALIELRDKTLPATQAQLDEVAAGLAQALGTQPSSTAVTVAGPGPTQGFDLSTPASGLKDGDTVTMTLIANGQSQRFTFKRVDDTGATVNDATTPDPNDKVYRLTGSSAATYRTDMQTAIDAWTTSVGGTAGTFSVGGSGTTLRVLANPAASSAQVETASANNTVDSLTGGTAAMPFFTDAGAANGLFTNRLTSAGEQSRGLASRIEVNSALRLDPSRLVIMQTSPRTQDGDGTRPAFLSDQLQSAQRFFSAGTGIGSAPTPYMGSVLDFTRTVISTQGSQAAAAKQLNEGQKVVVDQLQSRFDQTAGVNIDEEMTILVQLQNAYAANARVMSTVREMFDLLRQM